MKNLNILFVVFILTLNACSQSKKEEAKPLNKIDYWYSDKAEITSYELEQTRYGEIHKGKAVTVFVTEPFSPIKNTKADRSYTNNIPVLKLNFTKKFITGIYPYSLMTSSFFPFENGKHSLKISSSSQEWCGHTFMDLKNDSSYFNININSYFEGESQSDMQLPKTILEDDIWSLIRLQSDNLPIGNQKIIPSFFYLRLTHKETKAYNCITSIKENKATTIYSLTYPELERELSITFSNNFPHEINSWKETYYSGWGANRKKLTTKGKKLKTILSPYWQKNINADRKLRKELKLE